MSGEYEPPPADLVGNGAPSASGKGAARPARPLHGAAPASINLAATAARAAAACRPPVVVFDLDHTLWSGAVGSLGEFSANSEECSDFVIGADSELMLCKEASNRDLHTS